MSDDDTDNLPEVQYATVPEGTAIRDLELVQNFVLKRGRISRAEAESVDELLADNNSRLKILLVALGRLRAEGMAPFARQIQQVQDLAVSRALAPLNDPDAPPMSNRDVITLFKAMQERERDTINFFGSLIAASLPNRYDAPEHEEEVLAALAEMGVTPPNIQSRRNLTQLIDRLAKRIGERGGRE